MSTAVEALAAREFEKYRAEIGPGEAVGRFLRCYSKVRVRRLYAYHLLLYFRCSRGGGEVTSPATVALIRNSMMKFFDANKTPQAQGLGQGNRLGVRQRVNP